MKVIDVKNGIRDQRFFVELNSSTFELEIVWFPSVALYYLSILDKEGSYIIRNVALTLGAIGLSWSLKSEKYPKGYFGVIGDKNPDLENFGKTVFLLFKPV